MATKTKRTYGTGTISERRWADGTVVLYGRWRREDGTRANPVKLGPKRTPSYADGLTKTMAEAKLRELIAEDRKAHGTPEARPVRRGRSFKASTDAWLQSLEDRRRAPTYVQDATSALTHHVLPFFGADTPLESIDRDRCEAFVSYLAQLESARTGRKLSPKTVANYVGVLTAVMTFAMQRHWIAANPTLGLVLPAADDDGDVVEADQVLWEDGVARLLAAVPDGPYAELDRALYALATMDGVRKGEALGLLWHHVDLDENTVKVFEQLARGDQRRRPKSRKARWVPMAPAVRETLLELRNVSHWTADDDAVLADPSTGERIAWTPARKRYLAALEAAGLPARRFHDLRHTFASLLAKAGVPERKIQEWSGHSSPQVTRQYMHFAPASAHDVELLNTAFGHVANGVANLRIAEVPDVTSGQVKAA